MPNAIVFARSAAVLCALTACPAQKPPVDAGADDPNTAASCVVDSSRDAASAITLMGGTALGQICPRADVDWYAFDVPPGNDLLDLSASYAGSVTRVDLQVNTYLPDGVTAVPNGQIVDEKTDDSQSSIATTIALVPGAYLAAVRDAGDDERDDLNSYTLRVAFAKDPDTHEPNDTVAQAKAPTAAPGWFAYAGDVDVFKVTVAAGTPLLQITLTNGTGSKAVVHYALQNAAGAVIATGAAAPGIPLVEQRPVPAAGDYFVLLTPEPGRAPDRRPEASYTLALLEKAEPDANEGTTRNDTAATATCFGGTCDSGFSGGADVALPQKTGRIATTGDRDFFRFDVAAGAPAVAEITLSMVIPTNVQPAFDLFVPDAASACTSDHDCDSLATVCGADDDCEISHTCLPMGAYHFCAPNTPCRVCAGSGTCVPSPAGGDAKVCAATQFSAQVSAPIPLNMSGVSTLHTAQPLFTAGTYYVAVHDFQNNDYDETRDYTLDVKLWRERDAGDSGATAALRNNFYDPYPLQGSSHSKSRDRATDVTDILQTTGITGYISYASDEDWYKFKYPCVDMGKPVTCGIEFTWDQPASPRLRVAVLMHRDDLGIHESFVYAGALGAAQAGLTFGGSTPDCHQCSFADARHAGTNVDYFYYLQVRDIGEDDWEVAQPYHVRIVGTANGCPSACGYFKADDCACACEAGGACPPVTGF